MKTKLMKKSVSLLVALFFLLGLTVPVYAKGNAINVQLNGENLSFDVAPQKVNNRVLVPMRAIFEKLGAKVDWDAQNGAITAAKDETVIKLKLNACDAQVTKKGVQKTLQLDVPSTSVQGRTMVPVRFISECLGKQVGWDESNQTVVIIDYDYFFNEIKSQASNFYEFATNEYENINTGEINGSGELTFKYSSALSPGESLSGTVNADLQARLNAETGALKAGIKVTGLDDALKGSGLEDFDHFTFDLLFDNTSFYIKSNLFSLLEKENIKIGDKWIKADVADLGIPDVKTVQDLKKLQNRQSADQIVEALVNTPMELDIHSFKEAQFVVNALMPLIDNAHFKVTKSGDLKTYKWNIGKQDLVDLALSAAKSSGEFNNVNLGDLAEIKEFADSLVFDFSMETGVKGKIIVSSKTALDMKVDIPDEGSRTLTLKYNSQVLNPNTGHYDISIPDSNNVIDFKDLQSEDAQV